MKKKENDTRNTWDETVINEILNYLSQIKKKDIKNDYVGSDSKKRVRNKKKMKNNKIKVTITYKNENDA